MKKLLAVLLSLCLVVGMLPMMAFATDDVADTSQANCENTDVLNEGSLDGQDSQDGQSGGAQDGGAQDGGGDPAIPDYNGNEILDDYDKSVHSGGYNPGNIISYAELVNAINAGTVTSVTLGLNIEIPSGETLTINKDFTISARVDNTYEIKGPGTLEVGAEVELVNINVSAPVSVDTDGILKLASESNYVSGTISGTGKVVRGGEVVYDGIPKEPDPPEEEKPPVEEEPDPEPVCYTVKFDVKPYWAEVVVTDSTGAKVYPVNGQYWLEADKTYAYTVSAYGFTSKSGTITSGDARDTIEVTLTQSERVVVWPTSHGDVSFSYLSHGWVAVYVDPNNGYYLDDLTIYRVGYGAIDYGKWDNGVFYFRMKPGEQYIIDADFASAPSEYRVYVDSSILHGDVSVDTVYAEEGEWVYITVDPDVGYRLYNLTVTRPSGNTVKVEHVRDNVYRFSMPGVRVTVDAEFIRTVTPFTDVRLADWFYEYVSFAYRYGLMEGINSYQFAPDATATRAMVVQILYRMSGEPAVSYGSSFTDVASNAWYADAIAWAARNNIVNGTGAATFDPNAPVTREQFATMLYRYARYRGFNTSLTANILSYYDVNQVSEYAFEALQWACAEGIVNGTSTGYLTPQGNATRAQLAAMLMRFCNEYFDL